MSRSPRVALLLMLAFAAFALTLSLGNWQARRAAQKLVIEAQWDAAEQAPARELTAANMPAPDRLPMRVRLRGEFAYAMSVWLDNRQLDGRPGFWVVTPLLLEGGSVVLVNRGWAARDSADRTRRPAVGEPAGELTIEGFAVSHAPRLLELGDGGQAGPLPAIWQNLDFAAYEVVSGLKVAPLVVQQTSALDDGLMRRWTRPASGVDKHRGYAFQWYALAGLIALLTLYLAVRAWRARGSTRSYS